MERGGFASFVMIIIFSLPTFSSLVAAEWESDGWIKNLIGPDRLAIGDEFGCHGFENKDLNEDLWIIEECKDYLLANTNASRWGKDPISFGTPSGFINDKTSSELINNGFKIIGDMVSNNPSGLFIVERNGGSIEKNIANISLIEESPKDSLVSIYWMARIHDLRVREDKQFMESLESNASIWFTTWGEWYNHKLSSNNIEITIDKSSIFVTLPIDYNNSWKVPGSIHIHSNKSIMSIKDIEGNNYSALSKNDQNLKNGWRQVEDGIIATINPGETIVLEMENLSNFSLISDPLYTFNDLHHSVTVVGHHVTNMREWASDFLESPILFTWLIERASEPSFNWPIIIIAIGTLIATPIAIRWLIIMDAKHIIDYTD